MIEKLIQLGLTEREAQAYLALYNFQEATASQLAKVTKEHRTNIYDSLHSLIKKSLITYIIKNNVRYYKIVDPIKLVEYCSEKEKIAQSLIPELAQKLQQQEEKPIVEVFEGREGFKSILSKIIREGETIYAIGASEQWEKEFPIPLSQYMRERELQKIKAKLLYVKNIKPIKHKLNEIRFLPTELVQPSTIAIFGDYVAVLMWTTPLTATLTKSKQLSISFKKYFDVLWKRSK